MVLLPNVPDGAELLPPTLGRELPARLCPSASQATMSAWKRANASTRRRHYAIVGRAFAAIMLRCIALTWACQKKSATRSRPYLVLAWDQLKQHAARLRFFSVFVGLDLEHLRQCRRAHIAVQ